MRDEDFGQVNNLISCYSQTKLETSIGVKSRLDAISAMCLSLDPEIYANPKCWPSLTAGLTRRRVSRRFALRGSPLW